MKYTLLEMTQSILSSMDADEVTSISDTLEASQVAEVIRTAYFEIVASADLEEHEGLFTLTQTDATTPTMLTKPATVEHLAWFKYNKRTSTDTVDIWESVQYLPPSEFLDMMHAIDQSATTTESWTYSSDSFSATLYVHNDRAPTYWTSFEDANLICDAYDSGVDTYLKNSKTLCFGRLIPTFTMSDSFTPDLDDQQFNLLLQEAKALAWAELKQTVHAKAEKKAREAKIKLTKQKQDLPGGDSTWKLNLPNYGRK